MTQKARLTRERVALQRLADSITPAEVMAGEDLSDIIYPGASKPRRWTDDAGEGEPREPVDRVGKAPARFYAPPGTCVFCDRRRAAAKVTMRGVRERGGG